MAKSVLGVEFGSSRIKICEVKNDAVVRFVKEDMPENIVVGGEVVAWEALADFVGSVMKANHFNTKQIHLVIPDTLTYTRRLTLPIMTAQQLKVNLPYEFHDFISDDKDNYIYDYAVVSVMKDENGSETGLDVLGVAAAKDLIEHYVELFRSRRMKLVNAAPQCLAYGCLVQKIEPELADKGFHYSRSRIFCDPDQYFLSGYF